MNEPRDTQRFAAARGVLDEEIWNYSSARFNLFQDLLDDVTLVVLWRASPAATEEGKVEGVGWLGGGGAAGGGVVSAGYFDARPLSRRRGVGGGRGGGEGGGGGG